MVSSIAIETAKHILLSMAAILAAGALSGLLAQKARIPDVVFFLIAGILIGPEGIGLLDIKSESLLNQIILIFGASYILFDGGASVRLRILKDVWITLVLLATVGVLVTAALTGIAAYYIFGIPMIVALLLGATIASTDPATLVPIFKQVKIRDRVSHTIMSESAFNDATGAIATLAVLAVAMGVSVFSFRTSVAGLLQQSIIGILAGGVSGYIAALLIAHEKYDFLSEYAPVVTLMAVVGTYLAADGLGASGFMAVFAFGIVLGNKESFGFAMKQGENEKLEEFIMTTSLILRMFIFILLGSQVDFSLMSRYLFGGVAVVTFFMLIARPVTVFICALPDRRAKWSLNEMIFMCWTRETGVIPAALAGLLAGMKAPGSKLIASVTFIAVLMTIMIQATTARWLGRKLGLLIE